MAANIMVEVLKQLQRDITDQKDYMRNLHVIHRNINEKFNIMSEKMTELDNKVDKQQLTLERLEQLVLKNNKLLFGNDETEISLNDLAVLADKPALDKMTDLEERPNKSSECKDINQNPLKGEEECNCNDDNKNNDWIHVSGSDKDKELIPNEVIETMDNTEAYKQKIVQISPTLSTEEITNLAKDLKQIMYDVREIKEFLKETIKKATSEDADSADTIKILDKETPIGNQEASPKSPTDFNNEHISQLDSNIKQMMSEISAIKEETDEDVRLASPIREQEIVQISPTYFSADQLRLLNAALKETIEKYENANVLPVIQVIQGSAHDHQVIKELC